jgi:hypothetical protein
MVLVLDGVRSRHCEDVPLREHALLWPEPHELIPSRRSP